MMLTSLFASVAENAAHIPIWLAGMAGVVKLTLVFRKLTGSG